MSSNITFSEVKLLYEIGHETTIFCLTGACLWVIVLILLVREQFHFKRRRRGLARFHEQCCEDDEEFSTSTKYMISFFTSGPHSTFHGPPTGKVIVHLLGSIFPGKFHELKASKEENDLELFSPLGCEKFLVTEDVRLGRLIGLVLRTEIEGSQPNWNCSTTIVRDVKTNEAWFFRVDREIAFPPRLFLPATQEELCAFKFSLRRRLRREIRNGEFGYFSFLFRSNMSVFTYPQRWVTSIGLYFLFFVTCFLFLDFVFSPGHSSSDPTKYGSVHRALNPTPIRPKPGNPKILVLYGESAASYWILHAVVPALISSCLTTIIGFIMISFFREASKYEKHFDEMDYVIGTALFEQSRKNEAMKIKARAILPQYSTDVTARTSITTQVEKSIGSDGEVEEDSIQEEKIFYPVGDEDEHLAGKSEVEKSIYRFIGFLHGVTKKTLVLMKLKRKSMDEGQGPQNSENQANKSTPIYPRRSKIFEPGEKRTMFIEPELSPAQRRQIMRRLFLGTDALTGTFRRVSGSMGNLRLNSQNFMTFNVVELQKEKKVAKYDLAYKKPSRKWYQPIPAWIVVILVIILSISFISVVAVKGKFHKTASEAQFTETLLSTLVIGIMVGTFICEPFKIFVIALWEAIKDKQIYKRIEKSTDMLNASN